MKTNIFRLVQRQKYPGQDVFAGVLLHVVETALPVDSAGDRALAGIASDGVDDIAVASLDTEHRSFIERAGVAGLAAAFRIERGAVQNDRELSVGQCRFFQNGCRELPQMGILVI